MIGWKRKEKAMKPRMNREIGIMFIFMNLVVHPALLLADNMGGFAMPGDTPEKLADPDALIPKIDRLRDLKPWTAFATPEEVKLYEGPETVWPEMPSAAYNLDGFDSSILGGKVPPPGVHPRILFNHEDVAAMRKRLMSTDEGRKHFEDSGKALEATMLNPQTEDGKVFVKLESGDLEGLKFMDPYTGANGNHRFEGYPQFGLHPAHVCYWPRNLHSIAFWALLNGDEKLSRRAANAVYNYYKLREPLIDFQNARGADPNAPNAWPTDMWRAMHWTAGESHLGFAYDLTARYMSDEQKQLMRRVISKATAGKRSYGGSGPIRWRDTNWVGWDTQLFICHLAIEGEPGYDPDIYKNARDTIYGYLTYGINANGNIFETNGKNGAGLHFALTSAMALARRGDNLFGHPHLRKLSVAQAQQTVPDKTMNVNNGTYGCANFEQAGYLKNLYPKDRVANWLLKTSYNRGIANKGDGSRFPRIHPLTVDEYYDFAPYEVPEGVAEGDIVSRDYLKLPLDMSDDIHGQLNTRSSQDRNAAFMMFEARPDLYVGGHQQHDAGHFYFSALGVNWAIESDHGMRDSRVHNVVLIDGIGQGDSQHLSPSKVEWLGASLTENAAFAAADLTKGYGYVWSSPMHYSWTHPDQSAISEWRPETDPDVVAVFRGTQRWKCRIWDHSYWDRPWAPTMRGTYNPVNYAYRTAGLVRGERPYALIVDSIRKDDKERVYTWQMHLNKDIRLVSLPGDMGALQQGENGPMLIVYSLGADSGKDAIRIEDGEIGAGRQAVRYRRLLIERKAVEGAFAVLLMPHIQGQPMPEVREEAGVVRVSIPSVRSTDELILELEAKMSPKLRIDRVIDGKRQRVVER